MAENTDTEPASPGARLQAAGAPVLLANGREVWLRYGMAALLHLEDTYGSIPGVLEALNGLNAGGKAFTTVVDLIVPGLLHEGISRADLLADDLLDPSLLQVYVQAIARAFEQSFPQETNAARKAAGVNRPNRRAASRGASGSTSERSPSAGRTTRSGA